MIEQRIFKEKKYIVKFIEGDGRRWYAIKGHDYINDRAYGMTNDEQIFDCDGAQIDQVKLWRKKWKRWKKNIS